MKNEQQVGAKLGFEPGGQCDRLNKDSEPRLEREHT